MLQVQLIKASLHVQGDEAPSNTAIADQHWAQSCGCPIEAVHSTPELQGLGGTPGAPPLHPPQQLHSIQGGLGSPQETPPPLWAPFQGSATLTAQQFLLTFRWNSLGCSLCPLLLILALSTTEQSPAPSPAPSLRISISWRCSRPHRPSDPLSLLSCRHTARGSQPAPIRRCSRPHRPTALCWALSSGSHLPGTGQPSTGCTAPDVPPQGRADGRITSLTLLATLCSAFQGHLCLGP